MKKNGFIFVCQVLICLWMLFASKGTDLYAKESAVADTVDYETARKLEYFFLEANRQVQLGNNDAAFELLNYCFELNQNAAIINYELSSRWLYLKQEDKAEEYLKRAIRLSPDNYWYKNSLVQYLDFRQRTDETIELLEEMSEQFPEKTQLLLMLMEQYSRKEDFKSVIDVLNRVEVKEGKSEQLSMEKFKIYVEMDDVDRAFKEINDLAEEYPNDLRYRVLIGDLYLKIDEYGKAYDVYKTVESIDSTNVNVQLSLVSYYEYVKDTINYNKAIERLVTNVNMDSSTRLSIMNMLVRNDLQTQSDSTKMLSLFDKILSLPQADVAMMELCARYMVTLDVPKHRIIPVLEGMLQINPENELARNQLLNYAIEDNDDKAIINICKPAVDYSASNPIYYYFLGVAYYQQDSLQLSMNVFQKALQKVTKDTDLNLITNIYSILGDLYHDFGYNDKAYEAYDSCLIYKPEDAMVLNNYAYFLSLDKKDLERAEEMSAKSLKLEPDNPTYLDTYAWILFQQKRYAEAQVYIDSVLVLLGDSLTADDANLLEHAGDIYYKAGNKSRALDLWKQALELSGDKPSEALEQKVRKRKYIE
ncbi:MAG: hypothetical protein IJY78_05735 [Bacteroidaceae bacterium]|nr:hypothetical protein [Bacteroidaceae bacterium]